MIVDIFMPHMRGFESIRIFHERAPTIPLIAMSGTPLRISTRRRLSFLRDGSGTRRNALPAQAVHAAGAAHCDQPNVWPKPSPVPPASLRLK